MSLRDTPNCSCAECKAHRAETARRLSLPPTAPSPLVLAGLRCVEVRGLDELVEITAMGRASDYIRVAPPTWESRVELGSAIVSVEWSSALLLGEDYRVTFEKE